MMLKDIKTAAVAILAVCLLLFSPYAFAAKPEVTNKEAALAESLKPAPADEKRKFLTALADALRFNDFDKLKELEGLALKGSMDTVSDDPPIAWFNDNLHENFLKEVARDGSSAYWQAYVKKAETWMKSDPQSPTAPIRYAQGLMGHAWAIRGGGYSNTVSDEQWESFNDYMNKADNFLAANKGKSTANPAWYTTMYGVAQALGWPHRDYMELVREAAEHYSDYAPIYTSALPYMLPQWGGSFALIERHARQALEKTKAKHGNALYALIYADLMDYGTPYGSLNVKLFKLTPADWPTLNQGFKDFIARKSNTMMLDRHALMACLAGDKEASASALLALAGKPNKNVWPNVNRYVRCQRMSGLKPDYDAIYPDLVESDSMSGERIYALYIEWVNEVFQGEEFAKLEQIYAELNSSRKRFPTGEPMLTAFWQGIMRTMQEAEADDAKWLNIEGILARWVKAYPESVVANLMSGYQYFMRARYLHLETAGSIGHRFEAMKDYIGLGSLNKAKEVLEQNKAVSSKDVLWLTTMVEIGRFQAAPRSEVEQFFKAAAERDPYLWIIYFCSMRELIPYWGKGEAFFSELEKHAQTSVKYTKEKEGEALYALVYREFFLGDKSQDIFATTKVDWPRMKLGFKDLNNRYPTQWNLNNYAFFACMAKDKPTTRELMKQIGGKPVHRVWDMVPAMYYRCSEWAKSDE